MHSSLVVTPSKGVLTTSPRPCFSVDFQTRLPIFRPGYRFLGEFLLLINAFPSLNGENNLLFRRLWDHSQGEEEETIYPGLCPGLSGPGRCRPLLSVFPAQ